jgi:cytoskeletal protein CcmA (bactofilin family)
MPTLTARSPRRRNLPAWLLAVALLGVLSPVGAWAAEVRQGDTVTIGPEEVIEQDLYVFGGTVRIQGTVRGDVLAVAKTVDISGTVEGDVMSMAADTRLSGKVQGSMRSAARTLVVAGQVGEDAVLAGEQVRFAPGAQVGRDVLLAANEAELLAPVGGEVQAAAQKLTLGAPVTGNVHAEVGTLRLTDAAYLGGTLRYRSARDAQLASGATVAGPVQRQSPEQPRSEGFFRYAISWIRSLVGLFALGLLLVLITPDFARRVPATLRQSPGRSLGWGAAVFVGTPFIAALFFIAGALLGGWWIGLLALGLYAIALALCFPVVGMFIGRWLLDRFGKAGTSLGLALLLGLVLLTLAGQVPVLGALIALATVLFGLGALVLTAAQGRHPQAA